MLHLIKQPLIVPPHGIVYTKAAAKQAFIRFVRKERITDGALLRILRQVPLAEYAEITCGKHVFCLTGAENCTLANMHAVIEAHFTMTRDVNQSWQIKLPYGTIRGIGTSGRHTQYYFGQLPYQAIRGG